MKVDLRNAVLRIPEEELTGAVTNVYKTDKFMVIEKIPVSYKGKTISFDNLGRYREKKNVVISTKEIERKIEGEVSSRIKEYLINPQNKIVGVTPRGLMVETSYGDRVIINGKSIQLDSASVKDETPLWVNVGLTALSFGLYPLCKGVVGVLKRGVKYLPENPSAGELALMTVGIGVGSLGISAIDTIAKVGLVRNIAGVVSAFNKGGILGVGKSVIPHIIGAEALLQGSSLLTQGKLNTDLGDNFKAIGTWFILKEVPLTGKIFGGLTKTPGRVIKIGKRVLPQSVKKLLPETPQIIKDASETVKEAFKKIYPEISVTKSLVKSQTGKLTLELLKPIEGRFITGIIGAGVYGGVAAFSDKVDVTPQGLGKSFFAGLFAKDIWPIWPLAGFVGAGGFVKGYFQPQGNLIQGIKGAGLALKQTFWDKPENILASALLIRGSLWGEKFFKGSITPWNLQKFPKIAYPKEVAKYAIRGGLNLGRYSLYANSAFRSWGMFSKDFQFIRPEDQTITPSTLVSDYWHGFKEGILLFGAFGTLVKGYRAFKTPQQASKAYSNLAKYFSPQSRWRYVSYPITGAIVTPFVKGKLIEGKSFKDSYNIHNMLEGALLGVSAAIYPSVLNINFLNLNKFSKGRGFKLAYGILTGVAIENVVGIHEYDFTTNFILNTGKGALKGVIYGLYFLEFPRLVGNLNDFIIPQRILERSLVSRILSRFPRVNKALTKLGFVSSQPLVQLDKISLITGPDLLSKVMRDTAKSWFVVTTGLEFFGSFFKGLEAHLTGKVPEGLRGIKSLFLTQVPVYEEMKIGNKSMKIIKGYRTTSFFSKESFKNLAGGIFRSPVQGAKLGPWLNVLQLRGEKLGVWNAGTSK